MNDPYNALETCLQALESGAEIEEVLKVFPGLADVLRPVLEASLQARARAGDPPSAESVQRGRARVLARLSELRDARRRRSRSTLPMIRRLGLGFSLTVIFLLTGTGLVRASTGSLPGDGLYPVKRTWEDVRLLFVFDPEHRDVLEGEYDHERLDEVHELIQQARVVSITFSGVITEATGGRIVVSGVVVNLSAGTSLPGRAFAVGDSVIVTGRTGEAGSVLADPIQVLPPGSLATGKYKPRSRVRRTRMNHRPAASRPSFPLMISIKSTFHFEGTIESIDGTVWSINGRTVYVESVQIPERATVGTTVEVEGYFDRAGRFIVTEIEIEDSDNDGRR
jgi:hypothetical protein